MGKVPYCFHGEVVLTGKDEHSGGSWEGAEEKAESGNVLTSSEGGVVGLGLRLVHKGGVVYQGGGVGVEGGRDSGVDDAVGKNGQEYPEEIYREWGRIGKNVQKYPEEIYREWGRTRKNVQEYPDREWGRKGKNGQEYPEEIYREGNTQRMGKSILRKYTENGEEEAYTDQEQA